VVTRPIVEEVVDEYARAGDCRARTPARPPGSVPASRSGLDGGRASRETRDEVSDDVEGVAQLVGPRA